MSMNAKARAQAIYDKIVADNPRFGDMSVPEQAKLKASLETIFGGDLTYIQANAEIPGAQYTDPGGAAVATTGGPASQSGTVTSPTTISGTGKVF